MLRQSLLLLLILHISAGSILKAATLNGFITTPDSAEPMQYLDIRISDTLAGTKTPKREFYVLIINSQISISQVQRLLSGIKSAPASALNTADEKISLGSMLTKGTAYLQSILTTAEFCIIQPQSPNTVSNSARTKLPFIPRHPI